MASSPTITDSIVRHAGCGRDALVVDGHPVSYAELTADVRATAAALRGTGLLVAPDPRVAILLGPGREFVAAFLGAGMAGAAAVVLQRDWSDADLRRALTLARPALVVADAATAPRVPAVGCRPPVVAVDGARVAHAVAGMAGVGTGADGGGREAGPAAGPAHVGAACPRPGPAPVRGGAAPFYIGFTSGSTAGPKGFVRSHRSWLRSFDASAVFGIDVGDHVLAPGPLDHSLFLYATVHGLSLGATVHLQRRFSVPGVLDTLAFRPIAHVWLVPTMFTALVRAADRRARSRFPHVRTVICSGARWPATTTHRIADVFPNAEPIDFYGASETSFVSMRRPRPDDAPTCVGRPFAGVEVAVRRPDGRPADTGEIGTLWVRSVMLFDGYLDPDAPGAERDGDGWLTIGDLACVDVDGTLHLVGRETAMLVRGGVNVYPEEIEDVLMAVPEVAEAVVAGLADDYWGDLLCAVVRWEHGATLPRRRLRDHCRRHLARHKRPQRWLAIDAFPRTSSGKIARSALAAGLRDGTLNVRELT